MELPEISRLTEQELKTTVGAEMIDHVSVTEEPGFDGEPFLDIRAHSHDQRLPTARQSIDALVSLQRRLNALGEMRFANLVFVTAADAVEA